MTQEEKQLLLKDICARLPYGVKIKYIFDDDSHCPFKLSIKILQECFDKGFLPYLRPMLSITKEELDEYNEMFNSSLDMWDVMDWLNAHHFDFRNLIDKGLAVDCTNLDIY